MAKNRGDEPNLRHRSMPIRAGATDIDASPEEGSLPLSRGAPERKLRRVDRYDHHAEVTAYETLTSTGTVRISFRAFDTESFRFNPGQFIGIQLELAGYGWRKTPYCIVSPPTTDGTFQLLVRLVPEGPLSIYLGSLSVGDVIAFRGPLGRSMVPKEFDTDLVLLATGVGVGPFLSLVQVLTDQGFRRAIRLFWGLRLLDDLCLLDVLDGLVRRNPRFSYNVTLSQPPSGWAGLSGRLTESVPPLLPNLGETRYLLVGNGAMIEEMAAALSDLGVDRSFIYQEPFFNVRQKPDPEALAATRARFVASDLFSPYVDQQQGGLLHLDRPISARRAAGPPTR
ncbi:MAG: FAD-binding oxidoreductase [Actinomycetota bacterium]|nr:FAD-binding oxidoreductase [Actinomycetota bacterium]